MLAVLAEDLGLVPSTHIRQLKPPIAPAPVPTWHTHKHKQRKAFSQIKSSQLRAKARIQIQLKNKIVGSLKLSDFVHPFIAKETEIQE